MFLRENEIGRRIAPWVEPGTSLLDVGSGTGLISRWLARERGVRPTTSDLHEFGNRVGELPFRRIQDPLRVPAEDDEFETVMLLFVLHHIPAWEDQVRLLADAARAAKRRLIVIEDTPLSRVDRVFNVAWDWLLNLRHGVPKPFTFRDVEGWRQVFSHLGLRERHAETYRPWWPTLATYRHTLFVLDTEPRWYDARVPLEWIADPGVFELEDWERLRGADPEATFFHTPRFLRLYHEELGQGPPLVAVIHEGREAIGLCAFEIAEGTLAFLGGFEVTDYMGPVGRPGDRSRVAKELMTGIAARDDWERGDLEGLPEDGSWLTALAEAAEAAGLRAEVADDDVAPEIDLPESWDAYLAGLRSKQRHEVRRKARRIRERFPDLALRRSTPETFDRDLDAFAAMHRASEGAKGRFMDRTMERFFRRLGRELIHEDLFRLTLLEGGGAPLAAAVSFRFEDEVLLYNSAYDPRHGHVAPGMELVAELIREAIEEGRRRLDMLKGDLGYKYRFGAHPRAIRRLLLRRP